MARSAGEITGYYAAEDQQAKTIHVYNLNIVRSQKEVSLNTVA